MFWKNTAWSWVDAAADDDGGYLLAAELRKTPDSTPDTDLNRLTSAANQSDHSHTSNCPPAIDNTNLNLNRDISNQVHLNRDIRNQAHVNRDINNRVHLNRDINNRVHLNRDPKQLTVSIIRGTDGFGFTICSDCPVRVQAVDTGGPADHAGLRQGDSILQLNDVPVEAWKCSDLAHAIRSSPSHIILIVWRGLPGSSPELRSHCKALSRPQTHPSATGRKLLPQPLHTKRSRERGRGSGVRSSLGALGSLWRDRKGNEEEEEEEEEEYNHHTATLKGTRVTSSNGDNYIILSPVEAGSQLLQPVYHNRNGTIGRLYQTHPSRGANLLHDPQHSFSSRTATLPPPPSSTSTPTPPSNYSNYQNCTIIQSHLPFSGHGSYVTQPPKTLIFPIFVQPLDLCSPDRTLLMSEELILHQADLVPSKVTVLIYNDLLLLTREDEVGRCHVLQSPLYLNTLQLQEVASQPLHIYLLQSSQNCCHCLFFLEAFSIEQKLRISLCLHDNIQQQLVTAETATGQQRSDLPSDFHLLSLGQSDLCYRPASPFPPSNPPLLCSSSPYSSLGDPLRPPSPFSSSSTPARAFPSSHQLLPPLRGPVWKERGGGLEGEEEEKRRKQGEEDERQQGEGESASETSENLGYGRGLPLSPTRFLMKEEEEDSWDEEEEEEGGGAEFNFSHRPATLRHSLSEGSLSFEPRTPRFLSDSTIHLLTRPITFDHKPHKGSTPRRPSVYTLKSQLTREGGTLHHMMLLLNGTKDSRNRNLKRKSNSLAADVRSRMALLRQWKNSQSINSNSLEKALRNNRPSTGEVLRWAESLEALLTNQYGVAVFRHFLRSEFSEENLDFWLGVERFKRTRPLKMAAKAAKIYDEFISTNAPRQVNVDSSVRDATNHSLSLGISPTSFQLAQDRIFGLMETDSYPRFLKSHLYAQLANQSQA